MFFLPSNVTRNEDLFGVPVVFYWSAHWGWHLWQLCQCWVVQGDGVTLTVEGWNPAHTSSFPTALQYTLGWYSFRLQRHVMCVSIKAIYILTYGLNEDRLSGIQKLMVTSHLQIKCWSVSHWKRKMSDCQLINYSRSAWNYWHLNGNIWFDLNQIFFVGKSLL